MLYTETYGRTLQKIFTFLKGQQKMGKIKQLFKQPENAGGLEMCKQELHKAIEIFRVHHPVAFNPDHCLKLIRSELVVQHSLI
jgi:hypothetical protein